MFDKLTCLIQKETGDIEDKVVIGHLLPTLGVNRVQTKLRLNLFLDTAI